MNECEKCPYKQDDVKIKTTTKRVDITTITDDDELIERKEITKTIEVIGVSSKVASDFLGIELFNRYNLK